MAKITEFLEEDSFKARRSLEENFILYKNKITHQEKAFKYDKQLKKLQKLLAG